MLDPRLFLPIAASGGGIPKQNLLFYSRDGSTDTIGLSVKRYVESEPTGAVYYVSHSGSDTAPYDTWEKASNYPYDLTNWLATNGSPGATVLISEGVWNDYRARIYLPDANQNNITIIGSGRGKTVLNPPEQNVVQSSANVPAFTVRNLSLVVESGTNVSAYLYYDNGAVFENVDFKSGSAHAGMLIYQPEGTLATFKSCRLIYESLAAAQRIIRLDNGGMNFKHCIFMPGLGAKRNGYLDLNSAGTTYIDNCIIDAGDIDVAAGTINVRNSIVTPKASAGGGEFPITRSGGTVNVINSILNGDFTESLEMSGIIATDTDNIKTVPADLFTQDSRIGYITMHLDDNGALGYAEELEPIMAQYGVRGSFNIVGGTLEESDYSRIRDLVLRGVWEIGSHSLTHSNLTYDHAINISYTGADASPTVEFTAGGIIQLRTTEGNDNLDIDTTTHTTLGAITAFSGTSSWTIVKSSTDGQVPATYLSDATRATSLAVFAVTPAPTDIDFDKTGYESGLYADELVGSKAFIADTVINAARDITDPQIGEVYVCNTFVAPNNQIDELDGNTAIFQSGYLVSRASGGSNYLTDLNMFSLTGTASSNLYGDGTEAAIRKKARQMARLAVSTGYIYPVILHVGEDMTSDKWAYVFDEWQNFQNLIVTSAQLAAKAVIDGDWTDNGGGTYAKEYASYTDYGLTSSCPGVGAGTGDTLTGTDDLYDADEVKIYDGTLQIPDGPYIDGVDIGAVAHLVDDKYYLSFTVVSGTSPADWIVKAPAAPDLINIIGVGNTIYDASGVPLEIAWADLMAFEGPVYFGSEERNVFGVYDPEPTGALLVRINRYFNATP